MAVRKHKLGTTATVVSTELNSLANNAYVLSSSTYNNVQGGGGGDGYPDTQAEAFFTFPTSPTTPSGLSVWLLASLDGTNYEDGSSSVAPTRQPDFVFGVAPRTTAQRETLYLDLPPGIYYILIKNDGTNQALASTGNTLKFRPRTDESV